MSPLESAARALCEATGDPDEVIIASDGKRMLRWQSELWRVRAVLTAIRQPNATVFNKAMTAEDVGPWGEYPEFWISMIDAILEQGAL